MVQIVVKIPKSNIDGPNAKGALPEYAIIELQGDLESKLSDSMDFSGKFVGDLTFTKQGVPVFIIGHHILYGKSTKMDKPLAVMLKSPETSGNVQEYHIKAVIRRKILFKTRPKPIIANAAKKI